MQRIFFSYIAPIIAGITVLPLISLAWIADDLRKIHKESIEQKDARREQFRQEIIERRKEVLTKWTDRKQNFEEKLREEREKIKSGFELRRSRKEVEASSTAPMETQEHEAAGTKEKFFFMMKKSTQDIAQFFWPFKDLFENRGR